MSATSYKQLPPVPPPPSPRAKPALKKTTSVPHAALTRRLGLQRHTAGEKRGDEGGGDGGRRRSKKKKEIEVGEDVLATELGPNPSPRAPAGNLIDLGTDDSSPPLPVRSASMSSRPSPQPQHRRPPPPPPDRPRLSTVSGALGGSLKHSGGTRIPPLPPPKPSYLSSASHGEVEPGSASSSSSVLEPDTNVAEKSEAASKSDNMTPSPYLTFTPRKTRPRPAPRKPQESHTSTCTSDPSPVSPPVLHTKSETKNATAVAVAQSRPVAFPSPPPREMEYTEREHSRNVFDYLDKMRHRGDLCDVTLVGGSSSREIRTHKAVLAACSPYFESMFIGEFSEPDGEPIVVEEVEDDALEALVNFSYTSRIKITDRNIYLIFSAADLLQFSGVRSACFKFFKQQMNKSNCIRTWLFGESHNCTELLEAAHKYIECNFLDVVRGYEFLSLDQAGVVAKLLCLEDIAVTSEEQVYEAALRWLQHNLEGRVGDVVEVMRSVRFPNMSRDYLSHIIETEDLIRENSECLQMLIEALESFVTGTQSRLRNKLLKKTENETGSYINVKPRPAAMAIETVEFRRAGQNLGLRIMGGSDRPYHVFRQGDQPGIFILMVITDGAACKSGQLRAGDRILQVNGTDVSTATHDQAIRLLKTSPDPLSLLVRHEPAPPGLKELTLVTKPGEGFGISLSGGVNGYHGNPLDETDEGIFISQVIPGGAAERDGRLKEGTRILQVNSISMLGKTHAEALQVLQGVLDRINLLVCFGYDPTKVPPWESGEEEGEGEGESGGGDGCVGNKIVYSSTANNAGGVNGLLV